MLPHCSFINSFLNYKSNLLNHIITLYSKKKLLEKGREYFSENHGAFYALRLEDLQHGVCFPVSMAIVYTILFGMLQVEIKSPRAHQVHANTQDRSNYWCILRATGIPVV